MNYFWLWLYLVCTEGIFLILIFINRMRVKSVINMTSSTYYVLDACLYVGTIHLYKKCRRYCTLPLRNPMLVSCIIMKAENIFHIWYEMSSFLFLFFFNFCLFLVLVILFIDVNVVSWFFLLFQVNILMKYLIVQFLTALPFGWSPFISFCWAWLFTVLAVILIVPCEHS